MAQFLFRLQDHNMTNGEFAIFIFELTYDDKPWIRYRRYVENADDLPRRQRAFYAVKQVFSSIRHSKTELSNLPTFITTDWLLDKSLDEWMDG